MTINDLETFCNELYLFIHLLVQNVQNQLQCSVSFINYNSVLSASSSGGISSANGQSAPPVPPFCSSIKSDRELWDEWDWLISANTAREFVAVVGVVEVLGLSMLTSALVSFGMSSFLPLPLGDCNLSLLCCC